MSIRLIVERGREIYLHQSARDGKMIFTARDKQTGVCSYRKFSKNEAIDSLFARMEEAGKMANKV